MAPNPPVPGPCGPWISEEQVTACCRGLSTTIVPGSIGTAITYATAILFRASGRQFPGLCPRIIRPCYGNNCGCAGEGWGFPRDAWSLVYGGVWNLPALPERIGGEWHNVGACTGRCHLPCVTLPAPIAEITKITIDGVELPRVDPDTSRVNWFVDDSYRQLCRLDGNDWPCTNDLSLPTTEIGTWEVEETFGSGPGPDGELACARFACEIAKLLCNADDCQLPQRYKQIEREGVTIELVDPMKFLDEKGRVGVELVDLWIKSVNPHGLERRSTISRLDIPPSNYPGYPT